MLLTKDCGPDSWWIVLLSSIIAANPQTLLPLPSLLAIFLFSTHPRLTDCLSLCFCKLRVWVGWGCLWTSVHPWKCQGVAQIVRELFVSKVVSKVMSEWMHKESRAWSISACLQLFFPRTNCNPASLPHIWGRHIASQDRLIRWFSQITVKLNRSFKALHSSTS